jgi:predicted kinase
MATVYIYKGLPGSGKTTAAKAFQKVNPDCKRVNKDDLRNMLNDGVWNSANEAFVISIRDKIILDAVNKSYDIIVDDTNFEVFHERGIRELVGPHNVVEVVEFNTPIAQCIENDLKRPVDGGRVGANVIMKMDSRRQANENKDASFTHPAQYCGYDEDLSDAIICDIDGTLAHMRNRGPYDWKKVGNDKVDEAVCEVLLDAFRSSGGCTQIILLSGRDGSCREETEKWLEENGVIYDTLYMRSAGDQRRDSIVKAELFDEHIRGKSNVIYVLDDRDQVVRMWRNMGLKVFQVEYGDF